MTKRIFDILCREPFVILFLLVHVARRVKENCAKLDSHSSESKWFRFIYFFLFKCRRFNKSKNNKTHIRATGAGCERTKLDDLFLLAESGTSDDFIHKTTAKNINRGRFERKRWIREWAGRLWRGMQWMNIEPPPHITCVCVNVSWNLLCDCGSCGNQWHVLCVDWVWDCERIETRPSNPR